MSKNKKPSNKPQNFVAKHMNTFNHASVEEDRKKKSKRLTKRKMKHKGKAYDE
ncbi:hypothetical protein KVP40.0286 [Vibrio phage KVP40]|uniref:Uncharacterized protein n=4 Tax=Schizotequatrovirus KVP40 TaxID=1914019 RepID=Q6WHL7_BPKVM|nr:hypothetical protein KVP40.0286 [Vibrio phage KVP40]AFN37517.1 hypothetical protein pp2_284 [Vibrio phage phi-pp2]QHJ74465.1 hypothetical protein VH12019_00138 [Vibrio phage VH1_2019]QIW90140.1 hypothetical protein OLCHANIL_00043 [Vibrio phage V05]QIW91128.1 hypothetical protein COHAPHLL_00292 [Vibrio phage V09]UNA01800.1 hypothetical protein [Vibrio phage PC-Liy1]URQ03096.1 hypothetical protein PVA8_110 [Vibrio phage PVA8]WBM58832.1 hypothetical protein vBValMPVA8_110 [Vibrio phage vB_Va